MRQRGVVKTVILPKRNEADLEELPPEVRSSMRFVLVEHMSEVLSEALGPAAPPPPPLVEEAIA